METRDEWTRGPGASSIVKELIWYTDGSRMRGGGSRAGVYGKFSARMLSISLGKYVTVFQVEIFAVLANAHEIQMHPRPEKYVSIGCDSQVALKAFQAATVSPLVQ
jgi:hypothetical protein